MKKLLLLCFLCILYTNISAQSQDTIPIPVTFHFKPDYTDFDTLRMAGTFNGWTNNDNRYLMTDPDGDGIYELTKPMPPGEYMYKFVMDHNWGLAYTDPDNPVINVADANNSVIVVKDPMITYLLPRDINSRGERFIDNSPNGLPIRAIFAFRDINPINANSITVTIDGANLPNAGQYYNAAEKEFLYQPNPALSTGEHTVTVSITSSQGTDTRTSHFTRDPDYVAYQVPVDFYFDQYNTSFMSAQAVNRVAAVGTFNNWNDTFNAMADPDKDGLWETSALIPPGTYEYKFKVNGTNWVNDPDETKITATADANNLVIVTPDSIPAIKLLQPSEGTVYSSAAANINFRALLRPGVKSDGVDESTIQVKADGVVQAHSFNSDSSKVISNINFTGEGRHSVEVTFKNQEGLAVSKKYSYGIYTGETGVYVVDAENDDKYKYQLNYDGTCDILSVAIDETANHDSLWFTIEMEEIGENTRVGFIISNPSTTLINDPKGLNIKTVDWNGQGIFAAIGAPGNQFENPSVENRIMASSNPPVYSNILVDVNDDALTTNKFRFKISLAILDSIIGSWNLQRYFYVFSYLALTDGSGNAHEVTEGEGGSSSDVDPDIYDAAFTRSGFWQERMLSNYIPAGQTGGPRFVALDNKGRGVLSLGASDISDSLATFGPAITFLTPSLTYWYSDVTIHGELSDSAITTVEAYFNSIKQDLPVTNGKFSIDVTLNEGENIFYVIAEDSRGYKSISKNLVLTYAPDNLPIAAANGTVNGRQVTLNVTASSPAGSQFNYTWSADAKNPVTIQISPNNQSSAVVTLPQTEGEYIFNVRVRDSRNRTTNAKVMVVAKGDSVFIPGINYHSAWIDDAIVYEIYPRSFTEQGGFQGVVDRIGYMKDLGVNTIWFMPIMDGPTTHGYEITDYYGFETDYGNETSFRAMLTDLKANGFRVIIDYVVNYTSVQHPFMQNVFQYKENSPYADFYIWDGEPGNSDYEFLFDWSSLPNLNHDNPEVRKYFIDVAKHWVTYYGIDGYRCDVAWGVEQRNDLFWKEWRTALKNVRPDVFLEAEAGSDDPVYYQQRFDSANDWELRNKLIGALNGTVSMQTLHQEVTRSYPSHARPFRFMENHDEARVADLFDAKRSMLTHTILFTLNGIPLIYSGGEVGELTRRELINWTDPDGMKPYFKKLINIRKNFIHNPAVNLINNSDNNNVYSYSSVSGDDILITAANFRNVAKALTLDLSGLPFEGTDNYYLTDLMTGTVYEVSSSARNSIPIYIDEYTAMVFYYGPDSVVVTDVEDYAGENIPLEYKLFQNYPNPFNPSTTIKYQVKETGTITLKIFDILGSEVTTLINEIKKSWYL